mmetsp:Transcript_31509/g.99045  ORF Transcript_31509/g.99045 Transcript_31509/m.99045 type:complete len:214 (-) Transcript_31509:205-846(-)
MRHAPATNPGHAPWWACCTLHIRSPTPDAPRIPRVRATMVQDIYTTNETLTERRSVVASSSVRNSCCRCLRLLQSRSPSVVSLDIGTHVPPGDSELLLGPEERSASLLVWRGLAARDHAVSECGGVGFGDFDRAQGLGGAGGGRVLAARLTCLGYRPPRRRPDRDGWRGDRCGLWLALLALAAAVLVRSHQLEPWRLKQSAHVKERVTSKGKA